MFLILGFIIENILIQYIFICSSENILSYNEEIYLFSIYISLFFIIWNNTINSICNHVIKNSFNIIEFYESLYYIKFAEISIIKKYNISIKKKEICKYITKIIYSKYSSIKYFFKNEKIIKKIGLFFELDILNIKIKNY